MEKMIAAGVICVAIAVWAFKKKSRAPKLQAIPFEQKLGIPYLATPSDQKLQSLDLYYPLSKSSCPLLIFIHGGLWTGRDKSEYGNVGRAFAKHGIAVAVINYRLSSDSNKIVHPSHTEDCAAALQWLHTNANQFGYDRSNIFILGHSCGAFMAALLCITQDQFLESRQVPVKVRGCIGLQGLYDLKLFAQDFPHWIKELECSMTNDQSKWKSPTDFDLTHSPPWLIFHSPADPYLTDAQPLRFYERLTSNLPVHKQQEKAKLYMDLTGGHYDGLERIGTEKDGEAEKVTNVVLKFIKGSLK